MLIHKKNILLTFISILGLSVYTASFADTPINSQLQDDMVSISAAVSAQNSMSNTNADVFLNAPVSGKKSEHQDDLTKSTPDNHNTSESTHVVSSKSSNQSTDHTSQDSAPVVSKPTQNSQSALKSSHVSTLHASSEKTTNTTHKSAATQAKQISDTSKLIQSVQKKPNDTAKTKMKMKTSHIQSVKRKAKLHLKKKKYIATIHSGDLLSNLRIVAMRYHWHLVWNLGEYNYHTYGRLQYHAESFSSLIQQIVKNYPVKIQLYKKNKVMLIDPVNSLENENI